MPWRHALDRAGCSEIYHEEGWSRPTWHLTQRELTGDVKQAHRRIPGFIPGPDRCGCRLEIHPAVLAFEIASRFIRQPDIAVLPGPDDQPFYPWFINIFCFVQRKNVRGPVDGL